jgi:putative transposase
LNGVEEFPQRLGHKTPAWVTAGALFHIRIRIEKEQLVPLTETTLSRALLASVARYHALGRWWCELFLLMPDHLHALVQFPCESDMSRTVRDWKRGAARFHGVRWQDNYFDHRIRDRRSGLEKWHYIRRNPVAKGLCPREDDWPHVWMASRGQEKAR